LKFVAETKDQANELCQGIGWYGGQGHAEKRKAFQLEDNNYLLLDEEQDVPFELDKPIENVERTLRKKALDKLSDTDKAILGLKDE